MRINIVLPVASILSVSKQIPTVTKETKYDVIIFKLYIMPSLNVIGVNIKIKELLLINENLQYEMKYFIMYVQ